MTAPCATHCSVLLIALVPLLTGCGDQPQARIRADVLDLSLNSSGPNVPPAKTAQPQEFEERLLEIAHSYESYGRVHADYQWALAMCDDSSTFLPELAISNTSDSRAHGRKLYALYAKMSSEPDLYLAEEALNPVGQVVVKESWVPEEVDPGRGPGDPLSALVQARSDNPFEGAPDSPASQYILRENHVFRPKARSDLFVMFKLNPGTPETDEGWVYGIVTADGKKVTSAGRVASCMSCHLEAPHDRLFGPHVPAE
jgi:hypothetical protein